MNTHRLRLTTISFSNDHLGVTRRGGWHQPPATHGDLLAHIASTVLMIGASHSGAILDSVQVLIELDTALVLLEGTTFQSALALLPDRLEARSKRCEGCDNPLVSYRPRETPHRYHATSAAVYWTCSPACWEKTEMRRAKGLLR